MDKLFSCSDMFDEARVGCIEVFTCFKIRRNRVCHHIKGLGCLLLHGDIVTVESRLSYSNLGVYYIIVCLREVDVEDSPDILCFWTEIPRFTFFTV